MKEADDQNDPFAEDDRAEEARKKAELQGLAEAEDWKWLMSDKRGRRTVHRLLTFAGAFRSSYSSDALRMSYNEGHRNVGLMISAKINEHSPDDYVKMINEAKA